MRRDEVLRKEFLDESFIYDNGKLFWNERPIHHFPDMRTYILWNGKYLGKEAGSLSKRDKRWIIGFKGFHIPRSQIVWVMHGNEIIKGLQIDHINRNKLDDNIDNLRQCTNSHNKANTYARNKLKIKGVSQRKSGNYSASIRCNKKQIYLGMYKNIDDARMAYTKAAIEYFGEFACVD